MKHWMLIYEVGPEYLERRAAFRADHLKLAWESAGRGELLLGGALQDPVDRGLLLFRGETAAAAEAFAKRDPYVLNGLVQRWSVREWATVVGEGAANPIRP